MKKFIFITLICVFMALTYAFNKEPHQPLNSGGDVGSIELRDDPPNYSAFEDSINKDYVDTPKIVELAVVQRLAFSHTDGFITSTEQDRILDSLDDITTGGVSPQFIDVNILEDSIYIVSEGNSSAHPNFPDDIRPDGGLSDGQIRDGTWCDASTDNEGGGCGRVARAFAGSLALPANVLYYKDIRSFTVVGDCSDGVFDEWTDGLIEVSSTDFWHWKSTNCSNNGLLCLDAVDLDDQLETLQDIISDELPAGFEPIGLANGRYFGGLGLPKWQWFYYIWAAVPVIDNSSE